MKELTTNSALLISRESISMLNYGPNGSGKTTMLKTVPGVYTFFTEQPSLGLALSGFPVKGVVVETFEELRRVTREIVQGTRAKDAQSIALDSLSDITPLVIYDRLKEQRNPKNRSEWFDIKEHLKRFLISEFLRPLVEVAKKNVYVTARAMVDTDEDTKVTAGVPETIGQFRFMVRGLFDVCVYSEQTVRAVKGNNVPLWELHTVQRGLFFAKDALAICAPIEPPDFNAIFEKFKSRKAAVLAESK
jgi:energy-coupling factor transporter ATP-binding protein EcfA2